MTCNASPSADAPVFDGSVLVVALNLALAEHNAKVCKARHGYVSPTFQRMLDEARAAWNALPDVVILEYAQKAADGHADYFGPEVAHV